MIRELQQETNLENLDIKYYKEVYVKYPTYDFIYHMYHATLKNQAEIKINPEEHKSFVWKEPSKALKEVLIQDLDTCIKMFYKI
jgi:8-oxo-dGTP pyrophosphatase MutT (NUDIX family)